MFYRHDTNKTANFINQFFEHRSFTDLLPYRFYDPDTHLFVNNNSLGFLWSFHPLVGNPGHHHILTSLFQSLLPAGTSLQTTLIASPCTNHIIDAWKIARTSSLYSPITHRRAHFLSHQFSRNFEGYLSFSAPLKFLQNTKLHTSFLNATKALTVTFQSCGITLQKGTPYTLFHLLYQQAFFLNKKPNHKWDPLTPLNKQCLNNPCLINIHDDHISAQHENTKHVCKLYTAKGFPDQWSQESMSLLLGPQNHQLNQITTPFFISYGAHIADEPMLKARLLTKCAQIEKQAFFPLAKWLPLSCSRSSRLALSS